MKIDNGIPRSCWVLTVTAYRYVRLHIHSSNNNNKNYIWVHNEASVITEKTKIVREKSGTLPGLIAGQPECRFAWWWLFIWLFNLLLTSCQVPGKSRYPFCISAHDSIMVGHRDFCLQPGPRCDTSLDPTSVQCFDQGTSLSKSNRRSCSDPIVRDGSRCLHRDLKQLGRFSLNPI